MIEQLTNAWQWWTVPGAALGLWLLVPRIYALSAALYRDEPTDDFIVPAGFRLGTFIAAAMFMLAVMILGGVLPLFTDNRIEGWTPDSWFFRHTLGAGWLLFGSAAWTITVCLSHRWQWTLLASVLCWWAAFVSTSSMEGQML